MGLEVLGGFLGGGDKSQGGQKSASATSGDATSNLSFDFSANNAFQVGGSGSSGQTASADKGTGTVNNTVLYVALALAGLAVVGVVAWSAMRKA